MSRISSLDIEQTIERQNRMSLVTIFKIVLIHELRGICVWFLFCTDTTNVRSMTRSQNERLIRSNRHGVYANDVSVFALDFVEIAINKSIARVELAQKRVESTRT